MFSLIITIVSIALVAALAVATIYYGGNVMSQGQASAKASTIVNSGGQVAAAISLYRLNTGQWPATLDTLIAEKYLNGLPEVAAADSYDFISSAYAAPVLEGNWLYDADTPHLAFAGELSMEVCAEVNKHVNSRRMVLNVLDPGIRIQCVAEGSQDPVVFFRTAGVAGVGDWPANPQIPDEDAPDIFEDIGQVIDDGTYDGTGPCVYGCDGGTGGGGGSGGGGGGTPDPDPDPVGPIPGIAPEPGSAWTPCEVGGQSAYCAPEGMGPGTNEDVSFVCSGTEAGSAAFTADVYMAAPTGDTLAFTLLGGSSLGNVPGAGLPASWQAVSFGSSSSGGTTYGVASYQRSGAPAPVGARVAIRNVSCNVTPTPAPSGYMHDTFTGTGTLFSHTSDSGHGWTHGYWGDSEVVVLNGAGAAFNGDLSGTRDVFADTPAPASNYYVEAQIEVLPEAHNSSILLMSRVQLTSAPTPGATSDFIDLEWHPIQGWFYAPSYGTGGLTMLDTPIDPVSPGVHTVRLESQGSVGRVLINGALIGTFDIDTSVITLPGYYGFGIRAATSDGVSEGILVREFRAGAL